MRISTLLALVASILLLSGCPLNKETTHQPATFKSLVKRQFQPDRVDSERATPQQINGNSYPDSTRNDPHAYDQLLAREQ